MAETYGAQDEKETKQIFIEMVKDENGMVQTFVDWNKSWDGMDDVMLGLQRALGAVAENLRQQTQLNQRPMITRPPFVKRN